MRVLFLKGILLGGIFLVTPALMLVFLFPKTAQAQITADHLVISEIQTGQEGVGNSKNDFIEIHNPTNQDIDLNDYRLVKRTKSATSDTSIKSWIQETIISAGDYYLWVNSGYTGLVDDADTTTASSIADNNAIAIRKGSMDTGEIIDAVAWGENTSGLTEENNFAQNIPDGKSLERVDDTNDNSADFTIQEAPSPGASPTIQDSSTGSSASDSAEQENTETEETTEEETQTSSDEKRNPTDTSEEEEDSSSTQEESSAEQPSSQIDPEIFITEFQPNPSGKDSGKEWIEVYNLSSFEADLSGWMLDDEGSFLPGSSAYKIPKGTTIDPKSYKAFLLPKGSFALNNTGGDTVRLFNPENSLQDLALYTDTAKDGHAFAKNDLGEWRQTSIPTPGLFNQFLPKQEDGDLKQKEDVDEKPEEKEDKYAEVDVVFNEVLGNVDGSDEGNEWLEILNRGDKEVDLTGWYIDDEGVRLSKNAYQLVSGSVISPNGLLLVELTKDNFRITNTGDELRLISPDKIERDKVILPEMPEDKSLARLVDSKKWKFSVSPTPGEQNLFASISRDISISQVESAGQNKPSLIKLKNNEEGWVDLSFWKLVLEDEEYIFPKGSSIPGLSDISLNQDLTSLNIGDVNWQELKLLRPDGEIQSTADDAELVKELRNIQTSQMETNKQSTYTAVKSVKLAPKTGLAAQNVSLARAGVVVGESAKISQESTEKFANQEELPIIINKEEKGGFFHKMSRFIARLLPFW